MSPVMARLALCACNEHGRVAFSDGRTGGEFVSKAGALIMFHYAGLAGGFAGVDPQSVRNAFNDVQLSELPDRDEGAGDHLRKVVKTWNTAKLHNPRLDAADFHKTADFLYHYRAFDG